MLEGHDVLSRRNLHTMVVVVVVMYGFLQESSLCLYDVLQSVFQTVSLLFGLGANYIGTLTEPLFQLSSITGPQAWLLPLSVFTKLPIPRAPPAVWLASVTLDLVLAWRT